MEDISPGPLSGANLYAFLHVIIAIVGFFALGGMTTLLSQTSSKANFRCRTQMFKSILRQEIGYFDEDAHAVGSMTARLAGEPTAMGSLINDGLGGLASMIGAAISGLTIIFVSSWELALVRITLIHPS